MGYASEWLWGESMLQLARHLGVPKDKDGILREAGPALYLAEMVGGLDLREEWDCELNEMDWRASPSSQEIDHLTCHHWDARPDGWPCQISLQAEVTERLEPLRRALRAPEGVKQSNWVTVLAVRHWLRVQEGLSMEEADQVMAEHGLEPMDAAEQRLAELDALDSVAHHLRLTEREVKDLKEALKSEERVTYIARMKKDLEDARSRLRKLRRNGQPALEAQQVLEL